jgi:hypothetical protein
MVFIERSYVLYNTSNHTVEGRCKIERHVSEKDLTSEDYESDILPDILYQMLSDAQYECGGGAPYNYPRGCVVLQSRLLQPTPTVYGEWYDEYSGHKILCEPMALSYFLGAPSHINCEVLSYDTPSNEKGYSVFVYRGNYSDDNCLNHMTTTCAREALRLIVRLASTPDLVDWYLTNNHYNKEKWDEQDSNPKSFYKNVVVLYKTEYKGCGITEEGYDALEGELLWEN